jgi:hypothetical protein
MTCGRYARKRDSIKKDSRTPTGCTGRYEELRSSPGGYYMREYYSCLQQDKTS